jgi:integrase
MRGDGRIFKPKGSTIWHTAVWIPYEHREWRQSTSTDNERKARAILRERLVSVQNRLHIPSSRFAYENLRELIGLDYQANRRKLKALKIRLLHLDPFFKGWRAMDIGTEAATRYTVQRRDEGASNASINRELSVLGRMFTLAVQQGKVAIRPYFPKLKEADARSGFFEAEDFRGVLRELPIYLQPVMLTAYITGWRVPSELLTRKWRKHIDVENGWLRLEPGETKSGQGRMFPLIPALREIVAHQVRLSITFERETGKEVPWLFHNQGHRIVNYYPAWHRACEAAGVAGRIPHDFRRTAYRNLIRAGVPKQIAMMLVGHETESMAKRYSILDEGLVTEFAGRLHGLGKFSESLGPEGQKLEAASGFEPLNGGFADLSLNHLGTPPRPS